jgi:fatty-acyl-CoA synthase
MTRGDWSDNSMEDVFPQALIDSFAGDPGAAAFEHGSRVVTRGEALELIARFTSGLRAAGLGPGRGVAIATGVTPEGFAVLIAAHVLGCRVVGVRSGLTAGQLPYLLGDVDAVVADESSATEDLLAAAGGAEVLYLGPELLGEKAELRPQGRREDIAQVIFTSGSTGNPKGVAFSYEAMSEHWTWQPGRWSEETDRLAEGYRRYLLFGTLTSAVIQAHLGICLLSGGTAVIPESLPVFPDVLADLGITAALLTVPRLYHMLDTLRERPLQLGSLRVLIVAGSPLAPHRLAQAYDLIGGAVHHAYGQTEAGMITLLTADDVAAWPDALGSVGRIWPGVDLEIRDDDGRPVELGETGEIWVRAVSAFSEYWDNPAETAEVLEDGWVRTRDLGHLDGRGYLYLTGRSRDVIIVNAIIHYAGPIEQALTANRDVDQAYVVGAPDERTGEAAHAFVVATEGRTPDFDLLRAEVARKLGETAVPATITVVDSVPIAPSGKPDKRALLTHLPH